MKSRAFKFASVLCALALFAAPGVSAAVTVYLNGVDISTVRNKTFKNATVHVDERGDVHITADGYQVEVVDEDDKPSTPSAASNSEAGANPSPHDPLLSGYQALNGGKAQYDLILKINGVERKVIKAGSSSVIMEISAWLNKGENKIEVVAKKNLQGKRKSVSSKDEVQLLLGAGHEEENIVKMDVVEVNFKANASQLGEITRKYTVNAI